MAAKREKTATPGIYKRGGKYTFSYREPNGKQRWDSARTLAEAREARSARETAINTGEHQPDSKVSLRAYAEGWVERYLGRRRGGFREATRDEYRRQLQQYVYPYFGDKVRLTEVRPTAVAKFVAWLMDEKAQGERVAKERQQAALARLRAKAIKAGKNPDTIAAPEMPKEPKLALSDATIRNIMAPLNACLATARKEGLVRDNPARETDLPYREAEEDQEEEQVKALSTEELPIVLALIPERRRLFFRVLAATGLRISEARALQWRHLQLDGSDAHVKVRRALVKGHMGLPKSKYGRRQVPLHHELVSALREHRRDSEWPGEEDIVFPSISGTPMDPGNLYRRTLKPAAEEADVPWIGFHTFRHTCATRLFAEGRNAVQVQRWLGHHSPTFTLETYIGLLDNDLGEPLALPPEQAGVVTRVVTAATPSHTGASNGKPRIASPRAKSPSPTPAHTG
jgi:integrase